MLPSASRSFDPAAADQRGHPASIAANLSRRYLDDVRRFPMLEPQQEYILAKSRCERREREAAHQLPRRTHPAPIVFVVDDDISVRRTIESLIRTAGWQPETFETAQEFLAGPHIPVPSCLVLDLTLRALEGLELQRRLATDRPDIPLIVITGDGDISVAVKAMKAGAIEFLTKPFSETVLLSAIQLALEYSEAALRLQADMQTLHDRYARLSRREQEVMALVVRGLLNKQVAFELGISEITVKAHRGQVMRKMNASSFAELVNMGGKLQLSR
jgi:FixJ family two-component response regulator